MFYLTIVILEDAPIAYEKETNTKNWLYLKHGVTVFSCTEIITSTFLTTHYIMYATRLNS